ncbi:MAG: HDOD domain-containing protein [Verrucomicrobiota bacterium]
MQTRDALMGEDFFENVFLKNSADPVFRTRLIDVLKKGEDLPKFPASLYRLRDVVGNPNATLNEIGELIEMDASLTAQFIRLSNSSFYRREGDIASIHDALIRIGLNEVKNTVFAACLVSEFQKLKFPIDWATFWTHNLLVAKLTEKICDIYRPVESGEYLAGLLHDVGKLVFIGHFPELYENVMMETFKNSTSTVDEENKILRINHAQVGGVLCRMWKLNEKIQNAIAYHHAPEECADDRFLAQCIYVADHLATMCHLNIHQNKETLEINDINQIPAWTQLSANKPRRTVYIPLLAELSKAREMAQAFF